jgi:hypothetical protein
MARTKKIDLKTNYFLWVNLKDVIELRADIFLEVLHSILCEL